MNENQTIYGFDNSGCKHEVYTKEEVNNTVENINVTTNNKINTTILKNDITVIYGKLNDGTATLNYPNGFNWDNCVVQSVMFRNANNNRWGCGSIFDSSNSITGSVSCRVLLNETNIAVETKNIGLTNGANPAVNDVSVALDVRIVLMKIPNYIEGVDYTLGDVNEDGQITLDDVTKIQNYIMGTDSLTAQQYAAADVVKDGIVKASDYVKIQNYVEGNSSTLSDG